MSGTGSVFLAHDLMVQDSPVLARRNGRDSAIIRKYKPASQPDSQSNKSDQEVIERIDQHFFSETPFQ